MAAIAKRSLASGELDPRLHSRVDIAKYANGLKTCRNFFVNSQGGVTNRAGTKYISPGRTHDERARLIPFYDKDGTAYVLEMSDNSHPWAQAFAAGAIDGVTTDTITGITGASPCVITTSAAHGLSVANSAGGIYISGVLGMKEINQRCLKVLNTTSTTLTLGELDGTDFDSSSFGTYTSGGTVSAGINSLLTYTTPLNIDDLKYVQVNNENTTRQSIYFVHKDEDPFIISRDAGAWVKVSVSYTGNISAPANPTGTSGSGASAYRITAVHAETGEESLPSAEITSSINPNVSNVDFSWDAVTSAAYYNIYRSYTGTTVIVQGYQRIKEGSTHTLYSDLVGDTTTGLYGDFTAQAPTARAPFSGSPQPGAVGAHQQRLFYGADPTDVRNLTSIWASRIASFGNFNIEQPLLDDSSFQFKIPSKDFNEPIHIIDANGNLFILCSNGEFFIAGTDGGIITPTGINPKQLSSHGASRITPIVVDGRIIWITRLSNEFREIIFSESSFQANQLSIWAQHLIDGFTIRDMTYAKVPQPIIWSTRSDGKLLGMTYVPEQELIAWHQHDLSGGTVESVCAIPESGEWFLYLYVKRTINGLDRRYIERMSSRIHTDNTDIKDLVFLDSYLSYDGRNTAATTMTLSGGSTWKYDENLTLTSSVAEFESGDVGNRIDLTDSAGVIIRCVINAFTSTTVVTVKPHKLVPTTLRSVAVTVWTHAVDQVTGLDHLEGQTVGIQGDGVVVASPNNDSYPTHTVVNGQLSPALSQQYGVIHVGLPITADIETLNIDTVNGETTKDKKQLVSQIFVDVHKSLGFWAGAKPPSDDTVDAKEGLREFKIRDTETQEDATSLQTGTIDTVITSEWNSNGRIFLRVLEPVPVTILAITPKGKIPFR